MRHSLLVAIALATVGSAQAAAQTTYTLGRDTLRFREVTHTDVRLTTPQGEMPIKNEHAATVAVVRVTADTARAWYEALDIGISGPMGDQRPSTAEALKTPFTLSLDSRGRTRLISAPKFPATFEAITDLTQQFEDFFVRLPAQPLRIGLAWMDTTARTDSTAEKYLRRQAIASYRVERDTVVGGTRALVISMKQDLRVQGEGPYPNMDARLASTAIGKEDGIVVFSPSLGRLIGRRRTGTMNGDLTMRGATGEMSMKQSFTYTSTLDAVR